MSTASSPLCRLAGRTASARPALGALRVLPLGFALAVAPPLAQAATLRVDFQSSVTLVQGLPIVGISPALGDAVTGHFTYDTEALDLDPGDATHGLYASGTIQIDIGGLTLSSATPARQDVWDINGPNDLWGTMAGWLPGVDDAGGVRVNGVFTPEVRLGLFFTQPAGALTSDAQASLADLATLSVSQFQIIQNVPGSAIDRVVLFDDVTTLSARSVPVPATLPLLLTALLAMGAQRRRGLHAGAQASTGAEAGR